VLKPGDQRVSDHTLDFNVDAFGFPATVDLPHRARFPQETEVGTHTMQSSSDSCEAFAQRRVPVSLAVVLSSAVGHCFHEPITVDVENVPAIRSFGLGHATSTLQKRPLENWDGTASMSRCRPYTNDTVSLVAGHHWSPLGNPPTIHPFHGTANTSTTPGSSQPFGSIGSRI